MSGSVPLTGQVVDVVQGRGSVREVTTAQTIFAYLGVCDSCKEPRRWDAKDADDKIRTLECWVCKNGVVAERLVAEFKDMDCAHDCRYAWTSHCICSCNNVNHGRIWAQRVSSDELTETEVLEKYEALIRFKSIKLAVLKREQVRREADAEMREAAFTEWLEEDASREKLVMDLLASTSALLTKARTMVENSEKLSTRQERQARSILASRVGV